MCGFTQHAVFHNPGAQMQKSTVTFCLDLRLSLSQKCPARRFQDALISLRVKDQVSKIKVQLSNIIASNITGFNLELCHTLAMETKSKGNQSNQAIQNCL